LHIQEDNLPFLVQSIMYNTHVSLTKCPNETSNRTSDGTSLAAKILEPYEQESNINIYWSPMHEQIETNISKTVWKDLCNLLKN